MADSNITECSQGLLEVDDQVSSLNLLVFTLNSLKNIFRAGNLAFLNSKALILIDLY